MAPGPQTIVQFDTNGQTQNDELRIIILDTGLNLTADSFVLDGDASLNPTAGAFFF
jgi:hypothetical protein